MFLTFLDENYVIQTHIAGMKFLMILLNVTIVFWNLENFFAPDPESEKRWTYTRFHSKCEGIAKTILLIGDTRGALPDAVGFAEVGDRKVLEHLIGSTLLRKTDYRIIHYDSPDHRGIDCALLYRASRLRLVYSQPCHLYDNNGEILPTRDILLVKFTCTEGDTLAVLVNHHPSKVGRNSSGARDIAMDTMLGICDTLTCPTAAVGDFNDGSLFNGEATYRYDGKWEKLDGCFPFRMKSVSETAFSHPSLTVPDRAHGGVKPKITYVGPRYQGGISDHFPIVVNVDF